MSHDTVVHRAIRPLVRRLSTCVPGDLATTASDELIRARMHVEDSEIVLGQRPHMHPGPGWATVLAMLRTDRRAIEAELTGRGVRINLSVLPD